jgi:Ca2+/Na+ antiporter
MLAKWIARIIFFSILIAIFYFIFSFFLEILAVVTVLVLFFVFSIYSLKSKIKNLKKEDLENPDATAKRLFKYNKFARKLFLKLLKSAKNKEDEKKKDEVSECLKLFGFDSIEVADEKSVKKVWKQLAREYHPDLHTDEKTKEQMHNKLSQINECKDKIVKYYKQQSQGQV